MPDASPDLPKRFDHRALLDFAVRLFEVAGLASERARDVAEVLVEGDLLGRTTHGLSLAPHYLRELRDGGMAKRGDPVVLADHGAVLAWDGGYLPGPWLVRRAVTAARARLDVHPVVSVSIRRSHHIAALQAYLRPVTDAGLFILLTCSDPASRCVAPPGAIEGVYCPDPIAAGIPTSGDPVLIDISTSTTAMGQCVRAARDGARLAGPWLVDTAGRPTDDPTAVAGSSPSGGAILPLGGTDLGYKGFALGLLVEALSHGLAGWGRADGETRWGASVFLQIIDPARFGGRAAFERETAFLAAACRDAAVPPGAETVRLPGERALALRARQLAGGIDLAAGVVRDLQAWADQLGVAMPGAVG